MASYQDYIDDPPMMSVNVAPGQAPWTTEIKDPFVAVNETRQSVWRRRPIIRPMQTLMRRRNFDLVGNTVGEATHTYPNNMFPNWLPNYPYRARQVYKLGFTAPAFISSIQAAEQTAQSRLMPFIAERVRTILGG